MHNMFLISKFYTNNIIKIKNDAKFKFKYYF